MDTINLSMEKEPIFQYLNGMMSEFLDEYLAYEIKLKQMKNQYDSISGLRAILEQQSFIQSVRKKVLEKFLSILDIQVSFLNEVQAFDSSGVVELEYAEFLFNHDRYLKANELLNILPPTTERDFLLASIDLVLGNVNEGKIAIEKIVQNEAAYKPRVEDLYRKMMDLWLSDTTLQSHRKICIDRALTLCPDDTEALKLRSTWLKKRTLELFCSDDRMRILVELGAADKLHPIFDPGLCMFMALLHFINSDLAEGTFYIERALNNEGASQERTEVLRRFCGIPEGESLFDPAGQWVYLWIEKAQTDSLYVCLLQEILQVVIEPIESKVLCHELPQEEILRIEKQLDAWVHLNDKVPEWWLNKALCALGTDRFEEAMIALGDTVRVRQSLESQDVEKRRNVYLFSIFNLYADFVDKACQVRSQMPFDESDPFIWYMIDVFLMIRNGDSSKVETVFKNAMLKGIHTSAEQGFAAANESGALVSDIRSMDSIHGFSAWFLLLAKYMIYQGDIKGGRIYLRVSVNIDPKALEIMEAYSLTSYLSDLWTEDSKTLINHLEKGDVHSAERVLWCWYNARTILSDYCILKSQIISTKSGREKSLSFLLESLRSDPENRDLMIYCIRALIEAGQIEIASGIIKHAVALDRGYSLLWEELGDACYNLGDNQNALSAYEECLANLPDRPDVLRKIGDLYYITGKLESARLAYESILIKTPDDKTIQERLQSLLKDMKH
jgi:tetratricopeptide (TPR) repeat protein